VSPTWIEIDDEVMAKIKERAEPFVDSPNDSLRRHFGLRPSKVSACAERPTEGPPSPTPSTPRAASGELLPMEDYELPLLRAISQLGGSAPAYRVREAVEAMLADRLAAADRASLHSGDVRWENRLGFARLDAVWRGHLRSDSRRGIWELTDAGIDRLGQLEAELQEQERTGSR
jgi:Arc/MetJ family transcription regulator